MKQILQISSRRFAEDETFPLIAFDIVSRRKALNSLSLSCKLNPNQIKCMAKVSKRDLVQQLVENSKKAEAVKKGHFYNQTSSMNGSSTTKTLLKQVQVTLGNSFTTNEERAVYLRKAWALSSSLGGSAVFVTISPSETGCSIISFFRRKVAFKTTRPSANKPIARLI